MIGTPSALPARARSVLRDFLRQESAGGILLMGCAAIALIVANSPLAKVYFDALHLEAAGLSVQHWINDGLMALFFLLVGLEIKREVLDGELATWPRRALPGIAALGGMAVPALIYICLAPAALHGWAIPSATDIAFALGVLSLLGKRVPVSLKVFLTALAILDDLGAVLIIALFYTKGLSLGFLALAGLTLCALFALNRLRVHALAPYLALGAVLWFFVLHSGLHATLAGVALALMIPLRPTPAAPEDKNSPLHRLEHGLSPWVAFGVVPIFGLANAGVSFAGLTPATLLLPIPLAIAAGLFIGKQAGIFGFAWLAIRLRLADLPAHATWLQFYGVAILCGIGFTMSLFIALLAFNEPALQDEAKIGILLGSGLSAAAGWLTLRGAKPSAPAPTGPLS